MNLLREYARAYLDVVREHGQEAADAPHSTPVPPGVECGAADHETTDTATPLAARSDDRPLPQGRGRLAEAAPPST